MKTNTKNNFKNLFDKSCPEKLPDNAAAVPCNSADDGSDEFINEINKAVEKTEKRPLLLDRKYAKPLYAGLAAMLCFIICAAIVFNNLDFKKIVQSPGETNDIITGESSALTADISYEDESAVVSENEASQASDESAGTNNVVDNTL